MSAQITIAELARLLHPRDAVWRSLAMLKAFFDESGTDHLSAILSIAGFVGTEDAWTPISEKWRAILAPFKDKGVHWFHAADAFAQEGQFKRIDKPHMNYLITQFAQLLGPSPVKPIFSAVDLNDWDDVVRDADFLARFPTAFHLCFEDVVIALAEWAARYAGGERVAPIFAYRSQYATPTFSGATALQAYGAQDWYQRHLSTLGFDWPANLPELQAADLLAYLMRDDIEKHNLLDGPKKAYHWITDGRAPHGHWFDKKALGLTIRRFHETGQIYPIRA